MKPGALEDVTQELVFGCDRVDTTAFVTATY